MQCTKTVSVKDDEISRLLASHGERDLAVSVAETRAREVTEALAEAVRVAGERDAARAAEQAALTAATAARSAAADAAAAHSELLRQVGAKSGRITELEQQVAEKESKRLRAEDAARVRAAVARNAHAWRSQMRRPSPLPCGPPHAVHSLHAVASAAPRAGHGVSDNEAAGPTCVRAACVKIAACLPAPPPRLTSALWLCSRHCMQVHALFCRHVPAPCCPMCLPDDLSSGLVCVAALVTEPHTAAVPVMGATHGRYTQAAVTAVP